MKVSEQTNVQMPLKTVVSLITLVAVGTWAYFGLIQRITQLETAKQLMEADLLKKAEQTPVNQELYMLIEFLAGQNEVMEKEVQSIESNNINIDFIKTQLEKMQTDVENLKDKVRQNGSN
jgi:hypothetical protein|tara:strand:+ start:265 stop:624 length:360 start_codon:yes stop_codon:yes gene_type:complete